ncbi:MAG: sodium:phosphate symporter [Halobacteriovoraceae bacterium]|nr:sodium:phosphate symporter [Halobacteriovoraceae bacterium]|tara:strand:- start:8778 stop:10439 length:1662 start_codon:yes stop_codon:yes gene_type:complete
METFKIIYSVLGGLGIFFFGMKMMSDSLQQAASDVITRVINSLTTNRFLAVVVGMIVTMIVQSSSVTTVMTVGFVNAGLMQLTQAIGVIFGSNIGTTITGWIISIKVGKYGLLLIGLGIFPTLFSKNPKMQHIGKVLFGVGMIFFGLEIMSNSFKPLRTNQEFLDMIAYFSGQNYASYFASIVTGCLLTVIIQSSSAMLGITIALATAGVIEFNTAAALVMGENIGTTITALLASVGTTTNAKRAARAHAFFNVFGVLAVFSFLPWYLEFIEWMVPGVADEVTPAGEYPNIAAHIAASHTFFNITATILFLPFLGHLAKFVTKITPDKEGEESKHLIIVGDSNEIVPATAIAQAESEVRKMYDVCGRMYKATLAYIKEPKSKKLAKISEYENITDRMQKEVTVFMCKVMEKPMSEGQSLRSQAMIKIVDELESIADYLERMVRDKNRVARSKENDPSLDEEYTKYFKHVWDFLDDCFEGFTGERVYDISDINTRSEKLRIWADDIRNRHLEKVNTGQYSALSALSYSDMVANIRKIRAHAANLGEAVVMMHTK